MTAKDFLTRKLTEINTEIALIEERIVCAHKLGDSSSAQGISQTYGNVLEWQKRLDVLRRNRDKIEIALNSGKVGKINDGRVDAAYVG